MFNKSEYLREYRKNNREKIKEIDKRYREKHKEELLAKGKIKSKLWRENNKEAYLAAGRRDSKKYRDSNKEKIKVYMKSYRLENSEKLKAWKREYDAIHQEHIKIYRKEYCKIYSKNNREKKNALEAKREALKLQRLPKWADLKEISRVYKYHPKGFHVDHIVPLQGKNVSGLHVEYNLQYLTSEENIKKSNRFPYGDYQ